MQIPQLITSSSSEPLVSYTTLGAQSSRWIETYAGSQKYLELICEGGAPARYCKRMSVPAVSRAVAAWRGNWLVSL